MNDLTANRYINYRNRKDSRFTLNSFLFETAVSEKTVDGETLLSAVRDLLAVLRFKIQLLGYKYLSRLIVLYLADSEYSEARALKQIAEYYRADTKFIYSNIALNIAANKDFPEIAAQLLNIDAESVKCNTVSDAVEIVGAIFKIFYNYSVADEKECTALHSDAISYHGILL